MAIDEEKLKKEIDLFRHRQKHKTEVINELALSYTSKELAEWIFDEAIQKRERDGDEKIIITLSEFRRLLSIFKIKGVRYFKATGEMVMENRGAKDNRPENPFEL